MRAIEPEQTSLVQCNWPLLLQAAGSWPVGAFIAPRRLRRFGLSRHPPGCSVRPGAQAIRAANPWAACTAPGAWSQSTAESQGPAAAFEEEGPLSRHSNGDEGP